MILPLQCVSQEAECRTKTIFDESFAVALITAEPKAWTMTKE